MSTRSTLRHIYQATTSTDAQAATAIIAEAFTALPACAWLVPDTEHRRDILADVFEISLTHALAHGHIDLLTQSGTDPGTSSDGAAC
jgi:hypothetical protein